MSYGLPMRFEHSINGVEYHIIMRAYQAGEGTAAAKAISRANIQRYIMVSATQTPAMEKAWMELMATTEGDCTWAICFAQDSSDELGTPIGGSGLHGIKDGRAHSGIVIYDDSFWGYGIASACHRARSLYAHEILGIRAIDSSVIRGNKGSLKALENIGYTRTGTQYSHSLIDGKVCHVDNLTWVNPFGHQWDYFWGDNQPPEEFNISRRKAKLAIKRAKKDVTFM